MSHVRYVFHLGRYDTEALLPQVAKVLDKRMEIVTREQFPKMWKLTDKLHSMTKGNTRSKLRIKVMSVVCLALGVFLLVPSLMEPHELFVPLIAGSIATLFGIGGLWFNRKNKKNRFDKPARMLLTRYSDISLKQGISVSFSNDGMSLASSLPDADSAVFVRYSEFECIIEAPDLFLIFYDNRVLVLQKSHLEANFIEGFDDFMKSKVQKYSSVIPG